MRLARGKRATVWERFHQRLISNPLSVWREYSDVFEKVGLEGDVRVVVLASGLEKFFTAGIDCKSAPHPVRRPTGLTIFKLQ
jgi:hypothetical protein